MKTRKCIDCGKFLGEILEDGQYLRLGENVNLWTQTRLSCVCGRPFVFRPKLPPDERDDNQLTTEKNF